ncbi:hypothetical protein DFH07DRAFT_775457 [Mycena maculata]|uniref:Uncharacterized protein n=1 Tax=Mycena maculata TaxID=230809 RepID=A0AAD7N7J2_9AGAR|nr:hypothetical protein DFH07DRAFT_775457 [Mycena maculata]
MQTGPLDMPVPMAYRIIRKHTPNALSYRTNEAYLRFLEVSQTKTLAALVSMIDSGRLAAPIYRKIKSRPLVSPATEHHEYRGAAGGMGTPKHERGINSGDLRPVAEAPVPPKRLAQEGKGSPIGVCPRFGQVLVQNFNFPVVSSTYSGCCGARPGELFGCIAKRSGARLEVRVDRSWMRVPETQWVVAGRVSVLELLRVQGALLLCSPGER